MGRTIQHPIDDIRVEAQHAFGFLWSKRLTRNLTALNGKQLSLHVAIRNLEVLAIALAALRQEVLEGAWRGRKLMKGETVIIKLLRTLQTITYKRRRDQQFCTYARDLSG